jgi:hypothetical protein
VRSPDATVAGGNIKVTTGSGSKMSGELFLATGDSESSVGDIVLSVGSLGNMQRNTNPGSLLMSAGNGGFGGSVLIESGKNIDSDESAGSLSLIGNNKIVKLISSISQVKSASIDISSGISSFGSGSVTLKTGNSDTDVENVAISGGDSISVSGGNLIQKAGDSYTTSKNISGGNIHFSAGTGTLGGVIDLVGGKGIANEGGYISVQGGVSNSFEGGQVRLTGGNSEFENSLGADMVLGGGGSIGGRIYISAGVSNNERGGSTVLASGFGSETSGFLSLKTSDAKLSSGNIIVSSGQSMDSGSVLISSGNSNSTSGDIILSLSRTCGIDKKGWPKN